MNRNLILAALLLPAACGTLGAATLKLEGSRWSFRTIDGAPAISSKAELTIGKGRIGANVGCNGLGGDLKIKPGKLITGPMVSTMMYCDGVMQQERAVADLLDSDPSYKLKGDKLRIEGGGHSAELKRIN